MSIDADTGELEPLAVGVVPLGAPRGMPRQRLFLGAAGAVLRLDLATGERRTVIEPSGAPFPQLATRPGSPF